MLLLVSKNSILFNRIIRVMIAVKSIIVRIQLFSELEIYGSIILSFSEVWQRINVLIKVAIFEVSVYFTLTVN